MTVRNREAQRLQTNTNIHDFGRAMAELNLDNVPPEKRSKAVMDHLMRVMAGTITDRKKAHEIEVSRILRNDR
jgi:hypothetical protein